MKEHYTNQEIKPEAYQRDVYSTKDRWVSYYYQIKLVKDSAKAGPVLEVGIGSGVVANYLRNIYQIKTVDIISSLNPDYIASVEDMRILADNSFATVLCAEVLEHLPYEKFNRCLNELKRVSQSDVIISLPYWGYTFGFKIRLPFLGQKVFKFKISGFKRHKFNGQHYWEIGKRGFPITRIRHSIKAASFKIVNDFWDLDDPYHYYFLLRK